MKGLKTKRDCVDTITQNFMYVIFYQNKILYYRCFNPQLNDQSICIDN